MIGVSPTKVELINEDLSEYEARKQHWAQASLDSKILDQLSGKVDNTGLRRKEINNRLGIPGFQSGK